MGKRGPKPKPTALKLLEGCRADRIDHDAPNFPDGTLEPPGWLDEYGRGHWGELAPILRGAGLLSEGDRAALAQLCDDFSTIRKSVEPPDDWVPGDYERMRALMTNADKARDRYRRMLVEFGLTPSSRSRIKAAPEKPKDDMEEFLSRREEKKA